MNRELKFRAWDVKKKIMYGLSTDKFGFQFKKNGWAYHDYGCECTYTTSRTGVLMQYTGLKDRNGVEIYEGDIVARKIKAVKPLSDKIKKEIERTEGVLVPNALWYRREERTETMEVKVPDIYYFDDIQDYYEIIGNIYENPELIHSDKTLKDN